MIKGTPMSNGYAAMLAMVLGMLWPNSVTAQFVSREHPFILWTNQDAVAIKKLIETEPWAKAKYEEMLKEKGLGQTFRNLFRYQVMGDESIVAGEKKYLLKLVGKHPKNFLGDTGGGRHYDQYLDVLRYDVLYDRLTPAERNDLEDTFRVFINHHLHEETLKFTRTSWLPNMQWPRPMTAHLMALALRDEKLVREVFASKGGWKYYFDDYLGDGQFYFEEFGKQYSMIGEMLLWCRGAQRLGLDELGYGYTGTSGANMRRYLESIIQIGYPRVEIPGGRAHYPKITMGDARGAKLDGAPPYVFQHAIVEGVLPNGQGGERPWMAANMNGRDHQNTKVDKMLAPHWFEIAHARWPDGRFDYFLAQMRTPGNEKYLPSLYWGVTPIDPASVKPPPAPSCIARERGFAMLRADQHPQTYWNGESPAVALQLATYYVHYAHDAFSLLGFYAFNRPIYINRQISNGYGGSCPWTDSARGHCGVMVDKMQWMLDDADPKRDHPHWPNPIGEVPTRSSFDPLVKFVAARAVPAGKEVSLDNRQPLGVGTLSLENRKPENEVWPGVDMSRALFLTREYLCDIHQLSSAKPRLYQWHVHALGQARVDGAWKPTDELNDVLYDMANRQITKRLEDPVERERYQFKDVRRLDPAESGWTFTAIQDCELPDISRSLLGKEWYDRKIGARVWMLGEKGTRVYAGKTPQSRSATGKEPGKGDRATIPNEVGGVTLMVERNMPATTFVALHEPFKNDQPVLQSFQRIAQTPDGIAVAVVGKPGSGVNDRICYRHWTDHEKPLTLTGEGESFTFSDRLFIRISHQRVEVSGKVDEMKLKVDGRPALVINGQEHPAMIENGALFFKKK